MKSNPDQMVIGACPATKDYVYLPVVFAQAGERGEPGETLCHLGVEALVKCWVTDTQLR